MSHQWKAVSALACECQDHVHVSVWWTGLAGDSMTDKLPEKLLELSRFFRLSNASLSLSLSLHVSIRTNASGTGQTSTALKSLGKSW